MKYQGIRKIHEGKFITRYDVDYLTEQGHEKTYEIVSRNRDLRTLEDLQNKVPDSVIMILTDESGERILVNREYRMAMAQWIYNFPAGLIDPGETPVESARRELWEETGLTLERVDDVLDNSYSAVGFSNERNICVFGAASGEFRESTSDAEEIVPGFYTRGEILELLRTQPFAARTQAYCYAWARGGGMSMYGFYGWQSADIRDARGLTPRDYYDILRGIWAADTCAPRMRDRWREDNPTYGQCSITAFLMQDIFGGRVLGVPREGGTFHCFNDVDGCVFDLTSEQFGDEMLDYENCPEQSREVHFSKAEKKARYELLRQRLSKALA